MPPEKLPDMNRASLPAPQVEATHERQSAGPTIGIVIIVVLLLLGALYFWGEELNRRAKNPPAYIPGDRSATQ